MMLSGRPDRKERPPMKILVTAGELQKLISPEVELELVSTAAAQVAGHLVDKVKAKMPNHLQTVERAIEQQIKALASPNGLHSSVKNMVSTHVSEVAQGCAVALKDKLARDATDVALVRVDELTKARLEVFDKKTRQTPQGVVETCRARIKAYDRGVL